MGFQQGLSGLNTSARSLDVIGNNIANSSTAGYKMARTEFADLYAASLTGAVNMQVGIGTLIGGVSQQFGQGNITTTNNPLDLAIANNGFFRMEQDGAVSYQRNGQFQLDRNNYIVNNSGQNLSGYSTVATDATTGKVVAASALGPIQLSTVDLSPNATTEATLVANLDATKTALTSTLTGTAAPASLTITLATNDTLNVTVDGSAVTATIAPGAPYASNAALATAVQTAINNALTAASSTAQVTVTVDTSNQLVITSNQTGTSPQSGIAITGGNGATNAFGAATATGSGNFNPADPATYHNSTSYTVYDSEGNSHTLGVYFRKISTNTWDAFMQFDGSTTAPAYGLTGTNPRTLTFSTSGALTSGTLTGIGATPTGAAAMSFDIDLTGTTQYGSSFGVTSLTQDGYASGKLAGFEVGDDGVITGRYSNSQTKALAMVVLSTFANPQGLKAVGSNQWVETALSGQPLDGQPGTGTLGTLQSGAVEDSNVDLTAELVNMIVAQRMYQANAQTVKTQDSILQTLVSLR